MDDSGKMKNLPNLKGLGNTPDASDTELSSHSGPSDELKSLRSYKSLSSRRSSNSSGQQDQNMLDLILPRPVFKWTDPTLIPRFCHNIEFRDKDPARVKPNSCEALVHNIVQRQRFTDGKIRSQAFYNLIKVIRGNGLARNNALFQQILSQRGSVPIIFESENAAEGFAMDSFVKALEFFEVLSKRPSNEIIKIFSDSHWKRFDLTSDRYYFAADSIHFGQRKARTQPKDWVDMFGVTTY